MAKFKPFPIRSLKTKHLPRRQVRGFTLLEVMIVVGIIALLAVLAVPGITRARASSNKSVCLSNLRQIDGAKQQWGLELNKQSSEVPGSTDIIPYLKNRAVPMCPANGSYDFGNLSSAPSCTVIGHTY